MYIRLYVGTHLYTSAHDNVGRPICASERKCVCIHLCVRKYACMYMRMYIACL